MKTTLAYPFGALLLLADPCQPCPPDAKALPRIVMATLAPPLAAPLGQAGTAIYTEAFRRLGYTLVVVALPPARASVEADSGKIDGELGRAYAYAQAHPGLARVAEPAFTVTLSAYAVEPGIGLSGWTALRDQAYRVEYRMGIDIARGGTAGLVPATRLSAVPSTLQGLRKLAIGRTDVFIDFEEHVELLLKDGRFEHGERIFRAGTLQKIEVHAYLSRNNVALAGKLAAILKVMKREGVIDAYRRDAK